MSQVVAPVVVHVAPPGLAVAVYPVMGEPPLLVGAVHSTLAVVPSAVATTSVGALGKSNGATGSVVLELVDVPNSVVAVTVKV